MSNKDITSVKNITNDKNAVTVKVRVLHLWEGYFKNHATMTKQLSSIEMILCDEEGHKIQARVASAWIKRFRNDIKQDNCYIFKNLTVAAVQKNAHFYPTHHPQKNNFIYPSIIQNANTEGYFQERTILAPKHEVVQEINDRLLASFPGEEKEYLSSDSLFPEEFVNDKYDHNSYSPDVLNSIRVSGIPLHRLVLKVGVPVMLLRNIDQKSGLCNGTRLKVISLGNRVIEAVILSGTNIGNHTFIPRMSLTPSDKRILVKFKRRQFSIALCFAMTINKSQGQSLSRVGLFLRQPVFTHGQLYVALSRVTSREGLKMLILDNDNKVTNTTTNVVYKEVFHNLS